MGLGVVCSAFYTPWKAHRVEGGICITAMLLSTRVIALYLCSISHANHFDSTMEPSTLKNDLAKSLQSLKFTKNVSFRPIFFLIYEFLGNNGSKIVQ